MNAIEFDTIAHNYQAVITIPEAYREQWNNQAVHVIVMATDKADETPKTSLMSALKQIKITAPEDFSENLDAYPEESCL